jgi:hypothetical protein
MVALSAQAPEYSVDAAFEAERSIDRVLEKVDADQDDWVGERDFQAIDAKLKSISKAIVGGEVGPEFLRETTARFDSISLAEFKIVGIRRVDAVAVVDVRLELGGRMSGGLLSLLGPIEMAWSVAGEEWALDSATVEGLREVRAEQFHFTEITDETFGAIPSFKAQLSKDTDYWRGRLDAAVGVSVYGHQGISLGDADGDGWEDIYISQPAGLPNRLYVNNGDGTFSDVTPDELALLDDTSMSLFADVDNDGDQDLILISSEPMLFRNSGSGEFAIDREAGLRPPADRGGMFTGAALADYDLDGDLDLYVCSYNFWQAGSDYASPTPYYDATNGPPNLLFRNEGDGTFEEVTEAAGLMANNDRFSFTPAWGDYDDDGDPDLYVANDFGRNNLYRNNGDGTFNDVAAEAGVEDLAAGMSAAWGDYDNDGELDLYVANMWSSAGQRLTFADQFADVAGSDDVRRKFQRQARGNSLFRNNGDGTFADVSDEAGVTMGRWGWGADFVDLDNDGLLDLFLQNGYLTGERLDDL